MFTNKKIMINDEKLNSITHGFGALMSVAGVFFLIYYANLYGNFWHILSCSIYGLTLILLYMASAFYHGAEEKFLKNKLEKFDHSCIFLLIAGSYTPFTMVILKGTLGWTIFSLVWGMAVIGIIYKIYFIQKFKKLSTLLYLSMGWAIVFAIKPVIGSLAFNGLLLLGLGGLFYSVGVIFYLMDKRPYFHPIWHLFVLAGSISHFLSIMYYVIPKGI
jgi:hemolysin III